jgi:hypothetical protein
LERLLPRFEEDWGRRGGSPRLEDGARPGDEAATAAGGE